MCEDSPLNVKNRKVPFNFQKNSYQNNLIRIIFITVFDRVSAHPPYSNKISHGNMSMDPPRLLAPLMLEDSLPFN